VIPEALDGKRLFVTGTTGFLGTALVERLLRSVPGCHLVLLVRPGKRSDVHRRAQREIFANDAFDRLRESHGGKAGLKAVTDARVQVVAGDVSRDGLGLDDAGRAALASCDVVIHSAAAVSFDSPLDSAVEVNLLGPSRIAHALQALGTTPHLVAVSTCYVAGNRRGAAPEALLSSQRFSIEVDWRAEVAAARRARADEDATSRTPESLRRFAQEARDELGAAGSPLLAEKCEHLRRRWVVDRMIAAGRARAAALGWPDAYAYTKALGEQALTEEKGDIPVSIVRPSIIESSLAEPRPGWIRGFRMAEPVIISYARGLLKEFPGVPEGVVDVIPVDLVVAACIAVAARGPAPGQGPTDPPDITQVASGGANALRYRRLVDLTFDYFTEHPVYDREGGPIVVPRWSFPGRGKVQAQLSKQSSVLNRTEKVLQLLPLRGRQAEWSASIEERRDEVDRALSYVELYGLYTECEAVYGVDNLLELSASLTDADRDAFCFDPRVIDWEHYVTAVHLPSVVQHARVRTTPGKNTSEARESRLRRQVLDPTRQVAAFDLENTLIASNVVASYAWLATRRLGWDDRARFVARTLAEAPRLWSMDAKDRTDFLRHFYRRYDGAPVDALADDARELLADHLLLKAFPAGLRRVREHRSLGHRTVLITGALSIVIDPIRSLFDDVVCAEMTAQPDDEGVMRWNGELTGVPPTGESRAQALFDYCDAGGYDPGECVAYADSTSDLPFLEAVGFPVAVNPETRLAALARKRGWLTEHWEQAAGAPRRALPIAPGRPASLVARTARGLRR
jgi:HAD superfamily phosphoserine phosphatase-like hydrolase